MKVIRCICLLAFVLTTSCQNIDEIEEPKNLLSKSEMKNLIYDMVLLDAANGLSERKLKQLDIEMLEYFNKKYGLDSNDLKQNILYYNLRYDENIEIYEHAKDSIEQLKNAYDSISKVTDSLRKMEIKRLDSIQKSEDSISENKKLLKAKN